MASLLKSGDDHHLLKRSNSKHCGGNSRVKQSSPLPAA